MDHYERSKLADALKEETFNAGDYVIKQVSIIYNNKRDISASISI